MIPNDFFSKVIDNGIKSFDALEQRVTRDTACSWCGHNEWKKMSDKTFICSFCFQVDKILPTKEEVVKLLEDQRRVDEKVSNLQKESSE